MIRARLENLRGPLALSLPLLTGLGLTLAACGYGSDGEDPTGSLTPFEPGSDGNGADGNPAADPATDGAGSEGTASEGNGSEGTGSEATGNGSSGDGSEGPPDPTGIDMGDPDGMGDGTPAGEDDGMPSGEGMEPGDMMGEDPPPMDPATAVRVDGPCDVYGAAGTPCVAAYSMVRALSRAYEGPLYQVRRGAPNPFQNTGTGGQTQDIGMLPSGFADAAAQDAFCGNQPCTVSIMYDHSGRNNHLTVAKRGLSNGGQFAGADDFESDATGGPRTVGGQSVYSLYMETRQGYRQTVAGNGMPLDQAPQGIYMLADGTRIGNACCWDFGNVTPDPTQYHTMNTMFLGQAFWGRGAGAGPWFMADFEAGVWAGGSNPGDPGWGALSQPAPANPLNPSLRVPFALGFLKTGTDYSLRMADLQAATNLTTAYAGRLPKAMDNQGAVVIGVGGDNSNNSFGTFYEGAIVAGYPSNAAELAVMQNVQSAGYGR